MSGTKKGCCKEQLHKLITFAGGFGKSGKQNKNFGVTCSITTPAPIDLAASARIVLKLNNSQDNIPGDHTAEATGTAVNTHG